MHHTFRASTTTTHSFRHLLPSKHFKFYCCTLLHKLPSHNNPISINNVTIPTTRAILLTSVLVILMSSFLSRLTRPFSSGPMAASMNVPEGAQKATVAAGCFWGVEHMYRHTFANKGLIDARVGYIGGDTKNPGYRAVCSGATGRMSPMTSEDTAPSQLTASQTLKRSK